MYQAAQTAPAGCCIPLAKSASPQIHRGAKNARGRKDRETLLCNPPHSLRSGAPNSRQPHIRNIALEMPLLASSQGSALRLYVSKVGLGHRANIASDLAEFGVARLGENRAGGIGDPSRKERSPGNKPGCEKREGTQRSRKRPSSLP